MNNLDFLPINEQLQLSWRLEMCWSYEKGTAQWLLITASDSNCIATKHP